MNLIIFQTSLQSAKSTFLACTARTVLILFFSLSMFSSAPHRCDAQENIFSNEPIWWSGISNWTYSVALGDVDSDGDLDLACGNSDESSGQVNTLYLNEGGVLSSVPLWQSDQANMTISIALGDVDGDGDLDLVCGNYDQANTLYLNEAGMFATIPSWASDSLNYTASVALGDVDNDGDLDLVCGNFEAPNTLYLNDGGVFSTAPVWRSDSTYETVDIALGDVNGDGYLDLVCGNFEAPNTLYLNESGIFSTDPAWSSDSMFTTFGVTLGDVNGDGRLDLVCGNSENEFTGQSNTLYLNDGGVFSTSPNWLSEAKNVTWDIALGDIDGDGDLDLVCARWEEGTSEGNTAYLNTGGTFPPVPDWSAGSMIGVQSIILGDVDADGDLDMVCGNHGANAIYSNNGSFLPVEPDVSWGQYYFLTNMAYDIELGDIDGDGDPDLVVGNYNQANKLYLNNAGLLDTLPAWYSTPENNTLSVALGDVDGDGDLDLACGNQNENTFYLNEGGTFNKDPYWSSGAWRLPTHSIALSDVDVDTDLDVVWGNSGVSNVLFLNDGSDVPVFTPEWFSGLNSFTTSIALGDINADGFPDLVCGNSGDDYYGEQNTLYFNEAGVFSLNPAWSSGPMNTTTCIALGDIDADGDLDLVCGNCGFERSGQANTLYLNNAGIFSTTPDWVSGIQDKTSAIALEDVDCDGDLDLVCGNTDFYPVGDRNAIYLNNGGTLSTIPDWISQTSNVTTCLALEDIDSDGDMDLVCGSYGPSEELFLGTKTPVFKGDPAAPVNQLPHNSAFLKSVTAQKIEDNYYRIAFTAHDVESDPIWIVPEYQFKGDPRWYSIDGAGYTGNQGPFPSSPTGIADSFDWDISRVPFDDRDIVLRLRTVSVPKRVSLIQYVTFYMKEVGRIVPLRPEISISTTVISFPTVTVGDTSSVEFVIQNVGNLTLSTNDIVLPTVEMEIDRSVPFTLSPGERDTLTFRLKPQQELSVAGDIEILSNDPLSPSVTIQVNTDIRALDFKTKLLSQADTIPLADAVTVEVTPAPQVHIESGYLYHRSGGAAGGFRDSILLSPSLDEFVAVIPGTFVNESGLEYYIKVENSGVFATDPPGAPDSFFMQAVDAPEAISSYPKPNSGSGFLEGRPVRIEVSLPDGAVFTGGLLHYRTGGKTGYETLSLQYEDPLPFATIPDTLTGPRGLEYWVEVSTLTRALNDPPTTPARHPYPIQITVQNLQEEGFYPGSQYRMISVPLLFEEDFSGTIEVLLAEQPEFGPYDPVNWRSYCYVPDLLRYVELSEGGASEYFCPKPGRAFWLISKETNRITTAPITGYSTPTDSSCEVVLSPGWNMIGNPFNYPVAWDSILVGELTMAEADTIVELPIRWIINQGYQYGMQILEPFVGYWVKNLSGSSVVLKVPPKEAPSETALSEPEVLADLSNADEKEGSWSVGIKISCNEVLDAFNIIGVRQDARNSWDKYDRSEPPMSPGPSISLYFPHGSWKEHPGNYSTDIRGEYQAMQSSQLDIIQSEEDLWGHIWCFDVAKNFSVGSAGDEILLEFEMLESVPGEAMIYLIDRHLAKLVDIREEHTYSFYLGKGDFVSAEEETRFVLLIGSADFIDTQEDEIPKLPTHTVLHQNYPNPFNPSTIVRYEIAEAVEVIISIYDVKGALVKVLYKGYREPGNYEVGWNGENGEGVQVTSGIYFYRLVAGDFVQTKKMVLLR